MIFFRVCKSGTDEPVLRPLYDTDGFSLLNWLRLPESFSNLKTKFYDAKYVWFPGEAAPTVSLGSSYDDNVEIKNATKIYNYIMKQLGEGNVFPDEKIADYVAACGKLGVSEADAKKILEVSQLDKICRETGLNFPYNIDLGECDIETTPDIFSRIDEHNRQFRSMLTTIEDAENVTLTQKKETDELFIEIPNLSLLAAGQEIHWDEMIPPMAKVFTPYSDSAAYSTDYKNKVPKHLIPLIEGNPDKNGMSIQENEETYYKALCEWVQMNMKNEFGSDEMDVIDNISKSYLTELAFKLYARNWRHNPNIPIASYEDDFDPDDEDFQGSGDDSSIDSKYSFAKDIRRDDEINNAFLSLEAFLEKASAKVGWRVYVLAVIQIARWGERKGTALKFEGFDYLFDLAKNEGKYNVGNLDDYKLQLVNGKEFDFLGWIVSPVEAQDPNLSKLDLKGIPLGIAVKSKFVKGSEEIDVESYYSLFDVIPMLKDGRLSVNGITADLKIEKEAAEKAYYLSLSDLIRSYQEEKDTYLRNPFYCNETVRNLFLEFKIGKGKEYQSLLLILEQALKNSVFTEELQQYKMKNMVDAKQKVAKLQLIMPNALEVNIASTLFPVIETVDSLNEPTLEAWDIALKDWKGVDSFWEEVAKTDTKQEGGLKKVNAFSDVKQPAVNGTGVNADRSRVVVQVPTEAMIHAVTDLRGNVIGGFTAVATNRKLKSGGYIQKFILLSMEEYQGVEASRRTKVVEGKEVPIGSIPINYFLPKMVDAFVDMNTGKTLRLGFSSVDSMNYYKKTLDSIFGKGGDLESLLN